MSLFLLGGDSDDAAGGEETSKMDDDNVPGEEDEKEEAMDVDQGDQGGALSFRVPISGCNEWFIGLFSL